MPPLSRPMHGTPAFWQDPSSPWPRFLTSTPDRVVGPPGWTVPFIDGVDQLLQYRVGVVPGHESLLTSYRRPAPPSAAGGGTRIRRPCGRPPPTRCQRQVRRPASAAGGRTRGALVPAAAP